MKYKLSSTSIHLGYAPFLDYYKNFLTCDSSVENVEVFYRGYECDIAAREENGDRRSGLIYTRYAGASFPAARHYRSRLAYRETWLPVNEQKLAIRNVILKQKIYITLRKKYLLV
jgi:hypothetical protein